MHICSCAVRAKCRWMWLRQIFTELKSYYAFMCASAAVGQRRCSFFLFYFQDATVIVVHMLKIYWSNVFICFETTTGITQFGTRHSSINRLYLLCLLSNFHLSCIFHKLKVNLNSVFANTFVHICIHLPPLCSVGIATKKDYCINWVLVCVPACTSAPVLLERGQCQ